jgi:hypothetical protein
VTVEGDRRVFLGSHEVSKDYCEYSYDFSRRSYEDSSTGQRVLAQEENVISIGVLAELMLKIAGICWDGAVLREIADSSDASVRRVSPPRAWLQSLLDEDNMIDAFRHFYPTSQARFTCWHQFTNKRYENNGARIDYTLLDKCLLPHVAKGNVSTLRCCCDISADESLGESAALLAATACGRFQPVSFEGGGISEVSQQALDTQFGPEHTGMIYTPPSFSDHIAISLLLDDFLLMNDLELQESDSGTRKAQPHKTQMSIVSFLAQRAASTKTAAAGIKKDFSGQASKRLKVTKPSANSILHHFKKKTSDV